MKISTITDITLDAGVLGDVNLFDYDIVARVETDEIEYITTSEMGRIMAEHASQDDLDDILTAAGWELPRPSMDAQSLVAMAKGAGISLEDMLKEWLTWP